MVTMATPDQAQVEKRVISIGSSSAADVDDKESSIPTGVTMKKPTRTSSPLQKQHEPSELDSAMALAALAGLRSPLLKKEASWEERSPKATEAPTSPDQRSPGSPGTKMGREAEPKSPDSNKRVHFASGTKHEDIPETPPTKSPRTHLQGSPSPSRRGGLMMPPPHRGPGMGMFGARPQASIHFSPGSYRSPPHMMHYPMRSPHPPSPYHRAMGGPWFHRLSNMSPSMAYPPPRLMQPALMHPENQWICDFCNSASFSSYDEACTHEAACKIRCVAAAAANRNANRGGLTMFGGLPPSSFQHPSLHMNHSLMSRSSSGDEEASHADTGPIAAADSDTWHTGTMSLAMGEADSEWLTELNCYIRSHCIEAFSATEEDVARSSKRGRIALKQVGIRCRFCAGCTEKESAAVSFPTTIGGIYESIKRWQRVHLEVCELIPNEVRTKIQSLANTNVWVPTTRQYWGDSARAMGLVNTTEGIRFGIDPKEIASKIATEDAHHKKSIHGGKGMVPATSPSLPRGMAGLAYAAALGASDDSMLCQETEMDKSPSSGYVVYPEDMDMIPPYVYFLMRQVEPCRFTEADRFVARSKGPVGYPGFQCRHCQGHAGLGKYFPVASKSLATNSTSQNIHAHILKCRKTPGAVKDRLVQLKIEKGRTPRLEPGWRKIFFDKVWNRLHSSS